VELTDDERRYLQCLAEQEQTTFEQMAIEVGWTYQEVVDFGDKFFEWAFAVQVSWPIRFRSQEL